MFVEMVISRETLKQIQSSNAWITNQYEHNGLRTDGEHIPGQLIKMGEQTATNLGLKLLP